MRYVPFRGQTTGVEVIDPAGFSRVTLVSNEDVVVGILTAAP